MSTRDRFGNATSKVKDAVQGLLKNEYDKRFGSSNTNKANNTTDVESDLSVQNLANESRDRANTAREKRDNTLENYAKNRRQEYEREFNRRGLDDLKDDISDIGDRVKERRDARDAAVDKVSSNPFASAATITGRAGRIQDLENSQIANLLGQQSGLANQYARELGEIGTLTGYNDAQDRLALNMYNSDLGTNQSTYTQALMSALSGGSDLQDKLALADVDFQNQLALIREQAKYGGSSPSLKLITDPLGNPTSYFNPQTGQVAPITQTPTLQAQAEEARRIQEQQSGGILSGIGDWLFGS